MSPIATYAEVILGSRRQFDLYPDKLVICGREFRGVAFEHILPLRDLEPEFGFVRCRHDRFSLGLAGIVFGMTLLIVRHTRSGPPGMSVLTCLAYAVLAAGLFLVLYYLPKITAYHFCNGSAEPVFQVFALGSHQAALCSEFVEEIAQAIRSLQERSRGDPASPAGDHRKSDDRRLFEESDEAEARAEFTESMPGARRSFLLYPEKIVVGIDAASTTGLAQVIPLRTLNPEFRMRSFRHASFFVALGFLGIGCALLYGTVTVADEFARPTSFFVSCALIAAGLPWMLYHLPKITVYRFCNNSRVDVLHIYARGSRQSNLALDFVEAVSRTTESSRRSRFG